MLQIKHIKKEYCTGDLTQTALADVSINLRDNEFVAILGPSGSGKTTLLNIIGGLDRYDSGDLIINGISTKKYKDRDWDSYRNHTVGFVFQSYNLIPHQSVLANVELALTISGVKRAERRRRATAALQKVGLGNQLHKRPNQMSGGQMQRVAIARALVNNPDILLADEPTGALDTETSLQVMELLKEVAKDRLVVMVTHNPELATRYANRIVNLKDGQITNDSNPYELSAELTPKPVHQNMGRSSMSVFTALSLSFNNLRTKLGRTLLTSFAGSIGIIGIALILSLSTGANAYIENIQKDTMASYPLSIQSTSMDMSSFSGMVKPNAEKTANHELDAVYADNSNIENASGMLTSFKQNNLKDFKKYLDDPNSEIHQYVGENGITYSYAVSFDVYTHDPEGKLINTDGSTVSKATGQISVANMGEMSNLQSNMSRLMGAPDNFTELIPGTGNSPVSNVITENYSVLYGSWPKKYNEIVLVVDHNNEIRTETLYSLGLLPYTEYENIVKKINAGEKVTLSAKKFTYADICSKSFKLLPACDLYEKQENGNYTLVSGDEAKLEKLMNSAVELKVCGVVRSKDDSSNISISSPIAYTSQLTDYLIKHTDASAVVKAQKQNPAVNVQNGMTFAPKNNSEKISDTKKYLTNLGVSEKARLCRSMMQTVYAGQPQMLQGLEGMSETQLAALLENYLKNPSNEVLLNIYKTQISTGSYEENLKAFGVVNKNTPSAINIYADSFEAKDQIAECISAYNNTKAEKDQIVYTDYVKLLMSSFTTVINVVSYVLIAFVAVSLVVSSIMIGIITYISVLERTKEIGILRAIGASKQNVSQVFNAETFIIGLCAGLIGIGVSLLLLLPGNAVIHALTGSTSINAILPVGGAAVLVLLSMLLTLIGGLIPAKKAARQDPVAALRSE